MKTAKAALSKPEMNFAALIDRSIKEAGIKKQAVVNELGIHSTSFARAIRGEVKKPMAIAVVRAVNKLAKKEVVREHEALQLAGFKTEAPEWDSFSAEIGDGVVVTFNADKYRDAPLPRIVEDLQLAFQISINRPDKK